MWEFTRACGKKRVMHGVGKLNKKAKHRIDSHALLDAYANEGGREQLKEYIQGHSGLPGQRGNLELAHGFADAVAAASGRKSGRLWGLLNALAAVTAAEAPVNSPGELLPFCGVLGMGALAASDARFRPAALAKLRGLANDPRWRTREAVAQGLQRIIAVSPRRTMLP